MTRLRTYLLDRIIARVAVSALCFATVLVWWPLSVIERWRR